MVPGIICLIIQVPMPISVIGRFSVWTTYGFNSSYQFNDIAQSSNGRTEFAWYLIYKTIDNCNTAISIQGDSEELRQAQGQALALRAFCYLHLVQHYQFTYLKDKDAPCVPIYTEPSNSSTVPKG